jgi:hypothetical protein
MITTTIALSVMTLAGGTERAPAQPQQPHRWAYCDQEAYINGIQFRGGGMAGNGWDGSGQNSTTIYFHIENTTNDFSMGQRPAILAALEIWSDVVRINFVEIGVPNANRSIDFRFVTGNHCNIEPDECGDSDCPFDGQGGVLAHAGFPPGVGSQCVDPMEESWAGNVHFDEAEFWEADDGNSGFSLALIAAHEVGHALGLTHDTGGGGPHIMRPSFNSADSFQIPSNSDRFHIGSGYAAGQGSILPFEQGGIWVAPNWPFAQLGIQTAPFTTVGAAVSAVPPLTTGVPINIGAGSYPTPVTLNRPCTINAIDGTVTIGQ